MIDIPIGKALVAVEGSNNYCGINCALYNDMTQCRVKNCAQMCTPVFRKDGKGVFFKLVDYPAEEKL
jgi:hypothetical protein